MVFNEIYKHLMQFYVLFGSMVHLPSETDNYYYSSGWEQNWALHSQRHRTSMGKTNKNFRKNNVYSSIFKFLKKWYKKNYFYYLCQWVHVIYSICLFSLTALIKKLSMDLWVTPNMIHIWIQVQILFYQFQNLYHCETEWNHISINP